MSTTRIPFSTQAVILPLRHRGHRAHPRLNIKAQSFRDEGRSSSSNLVDSNMKVLKDRMEVMRTKERLERNCRPSGWDYASINYIRKPAKEEEEEPGYLQTMAFMCGTMSLPIFIGTALLYIFSVTAAHLT